MKRDFSHYDVPHSFRVPAADWRLFVKWTKVNGITPSQFLRRMVRDAARAMKEKR